DVSGYCPILALTQREEWLVRWTRVVALGVALATLVVGCAAPRPTGPNDVVATPAPGGAVKRITIGSWVEPDTRPTSFGQAQVIKPLISSGLADPDGRGVLHPKLAETVPRLENGLWTLFPDGRMETTWTIREGARWHDGTP